MFFTRNVADARKRLDGLKNQQLRSRQVALYKLLEAAALVAEMLSLPVALDGSGVSLAIALAGNRDARLATSCGFRERPGRRGDRNEFFAGDNPAVVNADRRAGCKPVVGDGKGQAEKLAGNNGNDANSSGRLRIRMGFAHSLRKPRSTRKHRSKIQSL